MCACGRWWPLSAKLPGGALAARVGPDVAPAGLDVGGRPELALGAQRQHGHGPARVVGHQHVLARGVNAEMRGAGAFGADRIDQRQMSVGAVDRVCAHGTGVGALVRRGLVRRVKPGARRVQRKPGRVCIIGEHLALDQGPAGGVHFKQVNASPIALASFRSLRRAIRPHIGEKGPARGHRRLLGSGRQRRAGGGQSRGRQEPSPRDLCWTALAPLRIAGKHLHPPRFG